MSLAPSIEHSSFYIHDSKRHKKFGTQISGSFERVFSEQLDLEPVNMYVRRVNILGSAPLVVPGRGLSFGEIVELSTSPLPLDIFTRLHHPVIQGIIQHHLGD